MGTKIKLTRTDRKQKIPEQALMEWRLKYQHGDIAVIAYKAGISRETVSAAFKNKRAQPAVISFIDKHYKQKEAI